MFNSFAELEINKRMDDWLLAYWSVTIIYYYEELR